MIVIPIFLNWTFGKLTFIRQIKLALWIDLLCSYYWWALNEFLTISRIVLYITNFKDEFNLKINVWQQEHLITFFNGLSVPMFIDIFCSAQFYFLVLSLFAQNSCRNGLLMTRKFFAVCCTVNKLFYSHHICRAPADFNNARFLFNYSQNCVLNIRF